VIQNLWRKRQEKIQINGKKELLRDVEAWKKQLQTEAKDWTKRFEALERRLKRDTIKKELKFQSYKLF